MRKSLIPWVTAFGILLAIYFGTSYYIDSLNAKATALGCVHWEVGGPGCNFQIQAIPYVPVTWLAMFLAIIVALVILVKVLRKPSKVTK